MCFLTFFILAMNVFASTLQNTLSCDYSITAYRIVNVFQHGGKGLDEISRNIGYEPYGVSIENDDTVWQSAGVHGDVESSKELIAWLHLTLARQSFDQTRLS